MADWPKIKAEYIRSEISVRALAKKYNVPYSTLRDRAGREKWKEKQVKKREITAQRMVDACATKEAEEAVKIFEAADQALEVIMVKLMQMRFSGEFDAQEIRSITGAIKDVAAVKGLQTEADRREQEARIAKLRKDAEDSETDRSVIVRIRGMSDEEITEAIG